MPFAWVAAGAAVVSAGAAVYGGIQSKKAGDKAAHEAEYAGAEAEIMGRINLLRQERNAYQTIGAEEAAVASAGFSESGSALDLLKSSVANASLDRSLLSTRTELEKHGQYAAAAADTAIGNAGLVSGIAGAASSAATAANILYGKFNPPKAPAPAP